MLRQVQSHEDSFVEAITNVVLGFVLALIVQAVVYPLFQIVTTITTDTTIAVIFTAVSLLRSYMVRRIFETLAARKVVPQGAGSGAGT